MHGWARELDRRVVARSRRVDDPGAAMRRLVGRGGQTRGRCRQGRLRRRRRCGSRRRGRDDESVAPPLRTDLRLGADLDNRLRCRSRGRPGARDRLRRSLDCRLLRRCGHDIPRRKQRQRIDVALRIARRTNAEVHVRLTVASSARHRDSVSLTHCLTASHLDRAEVKQGCRVAVRRPDRDRLAAARNGADKRDSAVGRRKHRSPGRSSEIDAAMLPRLVRRRVVEVERPEHRAVNRPGPRARSGRERERTQNHEQESPHEALLRCQI